MEPHSILGPTRPPEQDLPKQEPARQNPESPKIEKTDIIVSHEKTTIFDKVYRPIIGVVVGLLLLYFGVWNMGGFYLPGSRLSGSLAIFWYVWQIGTLLEIAGAILVYHFGQKLIPTIKGVVNGIRSKNKAH